MVGQVSDPVSDFPVCFELDTRRLQRRVQTTVQRTVINAAAGLHDIAADLIWTLLSHQAWKEKCQGEKGEIKLNEIERKFE